MVVDNECDMKKLIGQEMSSVTVATNYVRLVFVKYPFNREGGFESEASIDIEAGFIVRTHTESYSADSRDIAQLRRQGGYLVDLIGRTVTDVNQRPSGELLMRFDDSVDLEISVNKEGFESYHVHMRGSC